MAEQQAALKRAAGELGEREASGGVCWTMCKGWWCNAHGMCVAVDGDIVHEGSQCR